MQNQSDNQGKPSLIVNQYYPLQYKHDGTVIRFDLQEIIYEGTEPVYVVSEPPDNQGNGFQDSSVKDSVGFRAANLILFMNPPGYFHNDHRNELYRPIQLFQQVGHSDEFELVTYVPETPEDRARLFESLSGSEPILPADFDIADSKKLYDLYQSELTRLQATPLGLCEHSRHPCTRKDVEALIGDDVSLIALSEAPSQQANIPVDLRSKNGQEF